MTIASLLLLRKERGWFVTDEWRGTSSTKPLLQDWWVELNRDVGTPTQRQCSEDANQTGVFSRQWSGGLVQINCSDLSLMLPGAPTAQQALPLKSDDAQYNMMTL